MAWLTNQRVLAALARKQFVSIIVQKEDFLRPDAGDWSSRGLHDAYAALPTVSSVAGLGPTRYNFASEFDFAPVRCAGVVGKQRSAMPRMHHKFMVFCEIGVWAPEQPRLHPYAVWTGSFNATENGARSLENAVILRSPKIAAAYLQEWNAIYGISEPLSWSSEWVQPEYRIGT
jgi:phosphatidylserine/phosphatidylglycerophosphate/cardiolipin synthase-like enzyme